MDDFHAPAIVSRTTDRERLALHSLATVMEHITGIDTRLLQSQRFCMLHHISALIDTARPYSDTHTPEDGPDVHEAINFALRASPVSRVLRRSHTCLS